jgi:ankyrin repeat protein
MKSQLGVVTFDDIHRLIKKGDLVSLRHALDGGLNPDLSNRFSWTLLMLAAIEGNPRVGELLISRGATLDKTNDFGETALSLAAHGGQISFMRMLLAKNAFRYCRPHGHSLEAWVKITSGLSQDRIASILALLNDPRHGELEGPE